MFAPYWHKKLLPVQSIRQLTDSVIIAVALSYLSTRIFFPWPDGFFVVTVFAWLGILPVMSFVLPAKLIIETNSTNVVVNTVESILYSEHYRSNEVENSLDQLAFEVNLPRFLKWRESDVFVVKQYNVVTIQGPILMMRMIKVKLEGTVLK